MTTSLPVFVNALLFLFVAATPSPNTVARQGEFRASLGKNPYVGREPYLDSIYKSQVEHSIRTATEQERAALEELKKAPTAVWLSTKADVQINSESRIALTLKEAAHLESPPIVTLVVYNLPNRDCAADASAGEICCTYNEDGTCDFLDASTMCEHGLNEYKTEYLDLIIYYVKEYADRVPLALVIEPDSLPNLVTNLDNEKCGNQATMTAYMEGTQMAINSLSEACPDCALYLDAAHGGWLGWEDNSLGFAEIVQELGIAPKLRGFAVDVSNYQEMGVICPEVGFCNGGENADHECCQIDSCELASEFNPGHTILNYVMSLKSFVEETITGFKPKFIVDTSRNGAGHARADCSVWCNVRGAALGIPFTTKTAMPSVIDAYIYIKPPGESDGCTEELPDGTSCPRFDVVCASDDSIGSEEGEPRAPEAGDWFDYMIKTIVTNA